MLVREIPTTEVIQRVTERRRARESFYHYIQYTNPNYLTSAFSEGVCKAIDQFILDVNAGKRPVMIFKAPPQMGKSEMVSRKLPAYLLAKFPHFRLGALSYSDDLVISMAQDVRRNLVSPEHQRLFPVEPAKTGRYSMNRMGEFTAPGGTGSYLGAGIGGGITGRPLDIGIIDDPTKNEKEALSPTVKEGHWNWYQGTFTTRLSQNSGQIIMATQWAEDDLPARIENHFRGDPRLVSLTFPAINAPDEVGYRPDLPLGALVPRLKSLDMLKEIKGLLSEYWWSALYQQSARALGGNVFKEIGIHYYYPKDLPEKFNRVIDSWDCTFKDTDGTDFVVGQKWGKRGANSYLLAQRRDRMSFTKTAEQVKAMHDSTPRPQVVLIEDKANGPAVIDFLRQVVWGILAVEPDGSKLARAHSVTGIWEAGNIFLPHPDIAPWVKALVDELTRFPAAANDDQVDALTQAIRYLYPLFGRLSISEGALKNAMAPSAYR